MLKLDKIKFTFKNIITILLIFSFFSLFGCSKPKLQPELEPLVLLKPVLFEVNFSMSDTLNYYSFTYDVNSLKFNIYLNDKLFFFKDSKFQSVGGMPIAKDLILENNVLRLEIDKVLVNTDSSFDIAVLLTDETGILDTTVSRNENILAHFNSKDLLD